MANKKRELSDDERKLVVAALIDELVRDGEKVEPAQGAFLRVSRKFDVHKSTIFRIWKRMKETKETTGIYSAILRQRTEEGSGSMTGQS